jgi:hypothetical protein
VVVFVEERLTAAFCARDPKAEPRSIEDEAQREPGPRRKIVQLENRKSEMAGIFLSFGRRHPAIKWSGDHGGRPARAAPTRQRAKREARPSRLLFSFRLLRCPAS